MKPSSSTDCRFYRFILQNVRHLLIATLACLHLAGNALAGTGKIENGKVELNVLFLYNETDLNSWKPVFTEASKLLHNATEGNLQFGKINFFVACQPAKDKADIWISENTAGASSNLDGLGVAGTHIFLSNLHKRNDVEAHGQLGMVHELGHYIFSLRDEYGGCIRDPITGINVPPPAGQYQWTNRQIMVVGGGPAFYCVQPTGGTASIMDSGTTKTAAFSRTEFCVPANHIGARNLMISVPSAGIVNRIMAVANTHECEAESACWERVRSKLGLASIPEISTLAPSGLVPPTFNDTGAAARFVLCIDRSSSMAGARIARAKEGANVFLINSRLPRTENARLIPGDEVGVVAFDANAITIATLRELTSPAVRTATENAVTAITLGSGTAIGAGLRASLNQLIARGTPGCIEAIILLSDGEQNTGELPSAVLPAVIARKAVVFTIGVGNGSDNGLLANIASATGGKFFFALNNESLPGIFSEIQSIVTGAPVLERVKRVLAAGEEMETPVFVDDNIAAIKFTIAGVGFTSTLVSPSGVVSTATLQAPGVAYMLSNNAEFFDVAAPASGTWLVRTKRVAAGPGEVTVVAAAPASEIDGTHFQISAPSAANLGANPAAGLPIEAIVSQGPAILGASVTADVERPDGSIVSVVLRDSGDVQDSDKSYGDGVYSTLFRQFRGDGVYNFTVRAVTNGGFLSSGEDGPPAPPQLATPAVRTSSVSIAVSGVPVFPVDASLQVTVKRGGFVYNRRTQRFVQQVTLQNTSGIPLAGPVALVLDSLSSNATLANRTGNTAYLGPVGSPFVTVNIGPDNILAAQEQASVVLEFANPTAGGITNTYRILAGGNSVP